MTSFLQRALNIHPRGVVAALFGSYVAGATWNCCHLGAFYVHHTTMYHITSLYAKPHGLRRGHGVFSRNQPPALLAQWPGFFTCYVGNTYVIRTYVYQYFIFPCGKFGSLYPSNLKAQRPQLQRYTLHRCVQYFPVCKHTHTHTMPIYTRCDTHADQSIFSRGCSPNKNIPGRVDIHCSVELW